MQSRKNRKMIYLMLEFLRVFLIILMSQSIGNLLHIYKEISLFKTPMLNLVILWDFKMLKDSWNRLCLSHSNIRTSLLEFLSPGEESYFLGLLGQVKQCLQNQLQLNAKQHSLIFLLPQLSQSGVDRARNWSEFCLSWQDFISQALFLLMKSTVSWVKGQHQELSMKVVEEWKHSFWFKWME